MNGKTVIISGAGGALGGVVARRFAADGANLVLLDRSDDSHTRAGVEGLSLAVDLLDPSAVESAVAQATEKFGAPWAVVCIAGGFVFTGSALTADPADFQKMIDLNVKTAWSLSASAAKRMVEAGTGGRIVHVSARGALKSENGLSAYTASKAALLRLTESLAAELLEKNITVNAVLPSTIDTALNRKSMPDADPSRWVSADSLANVIAFLASDAAKDISGAAIPVYGKS